MPPALERPRTVTLGLCEDYPEESRTLAKAREDLIVARETGAKVLRIAFGWDAMEPQRGRYDWDFWDEYVRMAVHEYGIRLIPYICYTPKWAATDQGADYWRSPPRDPADFARFVEVIAARYRQDIDSWELWNEPDNQAYWLGTPQQFSALVIAGAAAVRRADPSARVVLGGIAGEVDFLTQVMEDGRVAAAVDVVNVHSYFETWHPSPIEHLPVYLESVSGLIAESGGRHPVWMAEVGYSSVGGRADVSSVYRAHYAGEHTAEAQAVALIRTVITTLATSDVELIAWYRINDLFTEQEVIGDDNNRHLGIVSVGGDAKPARRALTFLTRHFSQPFEPLRITTAARGTGGNPRVHAFRLADGRTLLFAWLAMPDGPAPATPRPDTRREVVSVSVPMERGKVMAVRDAEGREVPERIALRRAAGRLELDLSISGGKLRVVELR